MANSTNIAPGDDALAAQYNNLRLDIFDQTTGHDHDGTSSGGKKVSHGDLVDDAAIANTYLTHAKITKHVQGAGTDPDPDTTGGNVGVHGLSGATYVAGSLGSQLVVQAGNRAAASSGSVTFPVAFGAPPKVATGIIMSSGTPGDQGVRIYSVTASGFSFATSGTVSFDWIAVGTSA